ncbi:MAG: HD domain-containing phosphohydrolase [Selenomonadaceae bacterium]
MNEGLKEYAIEELHAGMIVGRSVYDENDNELIAEGTVLTNNIIVSLLDRPIFFVKIKMDDPVKKEVPQQKTVAAIYDGHVLDTHYVVKYQNSFNALHNIFIMARRTSEIDVEGILSIVKDDFFIEMIDGLKAITQIHNMVREGNYLIHHSIHVAILAGLMGHWLHMPDVRLRRLVVAGMLHDIGKTRIAENILDKPGKLSTSEFKIVSGHVDFGYKMLCHSSLKDETELLSAVKQHHERLDGSGYVDGLKGKDISEFARIIAILDMYDAMAANRVYAKKKSPFDVFGVLADDIMAGKLDAEYGVLFIQKICHSLNGNWVMLSNGKRGKIVYLDESRMQSLPIVQTSLGEFIDLNTTPDVKVSALLTEDEVN